MALPAGWVLFRSSRPDYIETRDLQGGRSMTTTDCSGLPDRTTLRREDGDEAGPAVVDCSGLPDWTTLRPVKVGEHGVLTHIVPVFQTGLH